MWPKTTLLLPVWPRDAKRLHTPGVEHDLARQQRPARESEINVRTPKWGVFNVDNWLPGDRRVEKLGVW